MRKSLSPLYSLPMLMGAFFSGVMVSDVNLNVIGSEFDFAWALLIRGLVSKLNYA